jgi:hypothetical protein
VSKRSGTFFGYEREDAGATAILVRRLFRWLHRGDVVVRGADVADVGDDRITLRRSAS